ncbi:MAG: tripartite tricarboxylate transporter substrate binding protein [Betaproteobacteria bacterium]|nr:tripartite tricarboxylate transporter substrate binding protein [Betaproteobacteria bacterium]
MAVLTCLGLSLHVLPIDLLAAQSYPNRPIRMVVPSSPGGGVDINTRIVSQRLADQLGVSVVVDNRAGASTMIGTEIAVKAPPDGYTLITVPMELSINPSLYPKIPYDALRDLAPVAQTGASQYALTTHPGVPANSVKQLIALSKTRPGGLNFGNAGVGSPGHLAGLLLQAMTGTKLLYVTFKGAGPAVIGAMSGEVDLVISSTASVVALVKSGKLRAIAVTGLRRFSELPEIPTVSEAGVPGYAVNGWYGILAPAGTPRDIINKLNAEIAKAVQHPATKERYASMGVEPVTGSPQEFGALLRSETEKWSRVIKSAGVRLD